ncbi:MAG: MerR family transcriptional regulator [Acidimicrobiales bacterium]
MNSTYKIAEVARRSGFNRTTLRYYEDLGLVPPAGRTAAGYRLYDDASLARLAFISRAKQLGCSLEEITGLVTAWEGERCEPVKARLQALVTAKLTDAQDRIAELIAFTAQLRQAAVSLAQHTPDGPCDDDCGCVAATEATPAPTLVPLSAKPAEPAEPAIACTLGAGDIPARLAAWQAALAPVVSRQPIEHGLRLVYPPGSSLAAVADLAAAEHECCMFFRFAITVDGRGAALEVTAPADAQELVTALFGDPS